MSCFWSRLDLPGSLGPPLPGSGTALHEYIEAGGLKMLYSPLSVSHLQEPVLYCMCEEALSSLPTARSETYIITYTMECWGTHFSSHRFCFLFVFHFRRFTLA